LRRQVLGQGGLFRLERGEFPPALVADPVGLLDLLVEMVTCQRAVSTR
jgi:hypothetical protein